MTDLVTLDQIIDGINQNNVLLPHFQREYVWNKSQQKKLILSVLTKLPSSSSLILKKQSNDNYVCLKIGMRNEKITEFGEGNCYYLLDGQQRYTTLYYAFHNIFKFDKNRNELEFERVDNKLRKRWYLKFKNNGDSTLNYENLIFDKDHAENLLPEDLNSFIQFEEIKKGELNDHEKDLELVEEKCKLDKKFPLFFLIEQKTELKRILKKIFDDRIDEIKSKRVHSEILVQLLSSKNFKDVQEKVNSFFEGDEQTICEINDFIERNGYRDDWVDGIFDHFHYSLKNYEIQPITMIDRNKAVKTFEYINTGGTNLSSFDLLCAKVGDFDLRTEVIEQTKEKFSFFNSNFNLNESFQLIDDFGLIGGNEKNPSVEKKYAEYLSQVLNLLHFKEVRSKTPLDKEFSPSLLKSNYSLDELEPEFIEKYYPKAVQVIKYSVALLQVFCSHKDLKSITNYLSLVQLFTYFIYGNPSNITPVDLKNLIGLFWLTLFTGRYNSHQNENSIEDAKNMYKLIFKKNKKLLEELFDKTNKHVLNIEDFATEELLTTQKCNNSVESNVFMFLRSSKKKILDLDDKATEITIENDIEIHHIIPLANATKVGESTREIRKKVDHLLNATMNKTPIRKETNRKISSKSIFQYHEDLENYNTQFDFHRIDTSWANISYSPVKKVEIKALFKARYKNILGDIRTSIKSSLAIE